MQSAPTFTPPKPKYFLLTSDLIVPLLVIVSVIFLLWIVLFSPVFVIQNIECQLDSRPCPTSSITAEIDKAKGINIFRFKSDSLTSRLTSADFTIRQVDIKKILPQTLHLELSSVYPVVALKLADSDDWVLFDDKLRVIRQYSQDPNVPTVIISTPLTLRVGESPTDPELTNVLSLTRSLSTKIVGLKSLTLNNHTLTLTFTDAAYTALLSPTEDLDTQISSLQAILRNDTIKAGVRVIDVRFAQPVLKYN